MALREINEPGELAKRLDRVVWFGNGEIWAAWQVQRSDGRWEEQVVRCTPECVAAIIAQAGDEIDAVVADTLPQIAA